MTSAEWWFVFLAVVVFGVRAVALCYAVIGVTYPRIVRWSRAEEGVAFLFALGFAIWGVHLLVA